MTQTIRSVELISGKRYLMETTYVPVWDGTERCGGRTLGTYGPPPPAKPRTFLVIPDEPVRVRRRRAVGPPKPRHVPAPPVGGPVFHARPAIWALLAQPVTVDDISQAIGGLPRGALKSSISLLVMGGAVVRAGNRPNPVRGSGIKLTSALYQRAPAYRDVASWPVLSRSRA